MYSIGAEDSLGAPDGHGGRGGAAFGAPLMGGGGSALVAAWWLSGWRGWCRSGDEALDLVGVTPSAEGDKVGRQGRTSNAWLLANTVTTGTCYCWWVCGVITASQGVFSNAGGLSRYDACVVACGGGLRVCVLGA